MRRRLEPPAPGSVDQDDDARAAVDDSVWMARARAGDGEAFAVIFQRHAGQIYRLVFRMVGNPDDAHDLTQECFIRAFKALPQTSADLNVSAWLHRIAANACLDLLRRRRRIAWLPWDQHAYERVPTNSWYANPEQCVLSRETSEVVYRVLGGMTPRHRVALVLREYYGMSSEEIGRMLGLSPLATKSVLYRAREEFRRVYRALAADLTRPR